MRAFVALTLDTQEAREFASSCLGWHWLEWQESWSARIASERSLPDVGVWEVESPTTLHPGIRLLISSPDDDLWGGLITLEVLPPPHT